MSGCPRRWLPEKAASRRGSGPLLVEAGDTIESNKALLVVAASTESNLLAGIEGDTELQAAEVLNAHGALKTLMLTLRFLIGIFWYQFGMSCTFEEITK